MSKTKGNVTGPDVLVDMHGADAVRLYILFLGPADQDMDWTAEGVEGVARFLRRLWRIVHEARYASQDPQPSQTPSPLVRKAHETIAKVSDDIGRRFVFNTPIAAVMELVNELGRRSRRRRAGASRRRRRCPDPAVRAARRRGAVGRAWARASVGAAVAGRGRVEAGPRDVRARRSR